MRKEVGVSEWECEKEKESRDEEQLKPLKI